jgi:hypothetical protein
MDEEEDISPDQEIDFCTLGMFIIGKDSGSFSGPDSKFLGHRDFLELCAIYEVYRRRQVSALSVHLHPFLHTI